MGKKFKWLDPSEKEIENAVLEYLKYQIGCFAFKVNTVGIFDSRIGAYRKPSKFIINGTPDVLICYNVLGVGVFVGMEIKSHTGRQSKEQKAFEDKLCERSNGFYFLIRSVSEAEAALKKVRSTIEQKMGGQTNDVPKEVQPGSD